MDESAIFVANGNVSEKQFKTKDYVRRAVNKYRQKMYNGDEEYRTKNKECTRNNYNKNKDNEEYKMKRKLYMREYRAKKKAEKLQSPAASESISNDNNIVVHNNLEKIKKNKVSNNHIEKVKPNLL